MFNNYMNSLILVPQIMKAKNKNKNHTSTKLATYALNILLGNLFNYLGFFVSPFF